MGIIFLIAGCIGVYVVIETLKVLTIQDIFEGCLFVGVLIFLVGGILRAAADKAGCTDKPLPGPWGAIERVLGR